MMAQVKMKISLAKFMASHDKNFTGSKIRGGG